MPCTSPITAYLPKAGGQPKFQPPPPKQEDDYNLIQISCRECISCMQRIALDWTIRQACEFQTSYAEGIGTDLFITHTYDPEHLPEFGHYQYSDMQAFWKRLRSRLDYEAKKINLPKSDYKFRYLTAAEYGDTTQRPHFHSSVFNLWLPDAIQSHENSEGRQVLTSKIVDECWGKGHVDIQYFTMGTATYVAQHQIKQNGQSIRKQLKLSYYARRAELIKIQEENGIPHTDENGEEFAFDPETGLILPKMMPLPRVYASSNPGIGKTYFDRYYRTIYNNGFITFQGRRFPIPRYYDYHLNKVDPDWFDEIEIERELKRQTYSRDQLEQIDQAKMHKKQFFSKLAKL